MNNRNGKTVEYTVIIPTLNAGPRIDTLLSSLEAQTVIPKKIIIIDSESNDKTQLYAMAHPLTEFHLVNRRDFKHGGTRNVAVNYSDTPFFVMMTQDALPIETCCMENLLAPFEEESVAAVCGRQVAYPTSTKYEKLIRAYRYPEESKIWSKEDRLSLGIKAYLLSDVCAAYRRSAFDFVNGFHQPLMTNEDMLIAADFLDAGYKLVFNAYAKVWHSHDYTLLQEFRRNREIGRFLSKYKRRFGKEIGEGINLFMTVSNQLIHDGDLFEFFSFCLNCCARISGNWVGKHDY